MTKEHKNSIGTAEWEPSYRAAGGRLWPTEPTLRWLNQEIWLREGIRVVLDAGCGDGKNMTALIEEGFFPIGFDASPTALARASAYLLERKRAGRFALLAPGLIEKLPLLDEALAAALAIDVLGHAPEPERLLASLARVLRPGGYLYASIFHPDDGCRTGPRMRPGDREGEYRYTPSVITEGSPREYYFRFYSEGEVRSLIAATSFELLSLEPHTWPEPPHQNYRNEEHVHTSWFMLLRKRAGS
jgi:SAM-dependent methyltransferase